MAHRWPSAIARLLSLPVLLAAAGLGSTAGEPRPALQHLAVPGRSNATPSIAALDDGVAIAWGAKDPATGTDVYVAVSRDAGRTFGAPVRVNAAAGTARVGGEFPPRVALAARAGHDPELVVTWEAEGDESEVHLARSRDGGRTFGAAQVLQAAGAPGNRGWHSTAVDARGTAHTVWLDHRGMAAPAPADGSTHAGHDRAARRADDYDGVAMAQRSGLYYAAASAAPTPERELVKGVCYCCKTAIATGREGRIYAAWRQVYPGNIRDIAFIASRDGGRTFGRPTRVSEDNWQIDGCPDDGPAMVVDPTGLVHIVWPTVTGKETPEGMLFYATTTDGVAFTPRVRVPTLGSPKPGHPQLTWTPGGIVIAWDEIIDGTRVVGIVNGTSASGGRTTFGAPAAIDAGRPSWYPVLATTTSRVVRAWVSGAAGSTVIAVSTVPVGNRG